MLRTDLSVLLQRGLAAAQAAGELPLLPQADILVERRGDALADYSTAEAMRLARSAQTSPRTIAEAIVRHTPASPAIAALDVAGPGFINLKLSDGWLVQQIDAVLAAGAAFGSSYLGGGRAVQVEFVSANPTGPLTVGGGRGGVVGDALARLLAATGHTVVREYYINDAGRQIELLGESVFHHYAMAFDHRAEFPADGYKGAYIATWGAGIAREDGDRWLPRGGGRDVRGFEQRAVALALADIRQDLDALDLQFDSWFSEDGLRARGEVADAIAFLASRGLVTQRDGATWFVGGAGMEDRENVLVRSRGDPTYFAADIAYHRNKFETRKFERVIDIWGADHHGHVPRMKAAVEALGIDPSRLEVLVTQMVGIRSGNGVARQGKRSGNFVTLRELLDEVGPAATRYFFLSKAIDSQMEFDLELAKREDPENPVYYIQMAHARCVGIQRTAAEATVRALSDFSRLGADEAGLVRQMLAYPEVVADAALNREPHRLAHFLLEFARMFHAYYNKNRVVTEDAVLTAARLRLVAAVRQVLANCLGLMGITAPERM